jgi:hypothetical protein
LYPWRPGTVLPVKIQSAPLLNLFSLVCGAGEEWYHFRQTVQQDMMRASSALHYIHHIQDIAEVRTREKKYT